MAKIKRARQIYAVMAGAMVASISHATMPLPYPNIARSDTNIDRNARWYKECRRVATVHATVPTPALPASCRTFEYYDRIDHAAISDRAWESVRACAEEGRERGVLAMLFANGLGVARDLDVATNYVCRDRGTPMELQLRVEHLMALQKSAAAPRYDHCHFAASGDLIGCHVLVTQRRADTVAGDRFASWRRQLPEQQIDAFDLVLATSRAFTRARQGEGIYSGSNGAVNEAQKMVSEHLMAFEKGQVNLGAAEPLSVADEEADTAQREWLSYRDAWIHFAALRYPTVPVDALKATLAQWRAGQPGQH